MLAHPLCLLNLSSVKPAELPLLLQRLACGFPSPAQDYLEAMSSVDELLIKNPVATYLARASGDSMIERGILDGSLLLVDRSIAPYHMATIVASLHGELTIKILDLQGRQLLPANRKHKPIPLPDDLDVICEGVVTFCIVPQGNSSFSC